MHSLSLHADIRHRLDSLCEGTGTRPDYLVNRADKKMRGHLGKNCTEIDSLGSAIRLAIATALRTMFPL